MVGWKVTAMIVTSRRGMLAGLAGLGAGLGIIGVPKLTLAPLSATPAPLLRLPDTTLILSRRLERGLGVDGAAIIVTRRWQVRFDRQARGIIVTGEQISAEVKAPPQFAQLSAIEQQRDAAGMFPILLSDTGVIMPSSASFTPSEDIASALRAAEAYIAQQDVPPDQRDAIRFYLAQLHKAGSLQLDMMPPDLLFPAGRPAERNDTVALPGGLSGSFSFRYEAQPQADAPWLKHAECWIITRVEGLERRAHEVWTLGPV